MGIRARIAATRELKAADRQLTTADLTATSDTDTDWSAANRRVNDALQDPALPYRHQDPAERGPRWKH